ncbi:unnamed protein product, partial [Heligmosomoides polygyrus]|uniref:Chromo domain-containing protein n=1 Tax=Heligmosomoides polygyrus TaxID=6339 RepID=A0A183GBU5_HELPZ
MEFSVGDFVRCVWGTNPREYEAKVVHVNCASKEYFVHYQGWNKRYDEWIPAESIVGPSYQHHTSSTNCTTPKIRQSKREKRTKKPIDWSPTANIVARVAEKASPEKVVPPKVHVPLPTKRKQSPLLKASKPSQPTPPVIPVISEDSTEESSDNEDDVNKLPRSYIDVLAKAKKRAERRSQRNSTQKADSGTPQGSNNTSEPGCMDSGSDPLAKPQEQENNLGSASTSSAIVSSTSAECHGFSPIGGDHNYSSLRFHYDETPPPDTSEKEPSTSHVTSSTKRVNILPVRKPLNIQYSFPLAPSLFKLARSPPIKLSRRLPCDAPNLGTPFSYNDEFHAAGRSLAARQDIAGAGQDIAGAGQDITGAGQHIAGAGQDILQISAGHSADF